MVTKTRRSHSYC